MIPTNRTQKGWGRGRSQASHRPQDWRSVEIAPAGTFLGRACNLACTLLQTKLEFYPLRWATYFRRRALLRVRHGQHPPTAGVKPQD